MSEAASNKRCKALLDLIGSDDAGGYDSFIEYYNADWINETTQLVQIPSYVIDTPSTYPDDEKVFRQPKPVMHYIKDIAIDEFAITEPIEYYEYPLTRWQLESGYRYYLGVNKEANSVVFAYLGRR